MRTIRKVAGLMAVACLLVVAAAMAFDPPRPCEKCGGHLVPHSRNSSVLECKSCDFMVHASHWSQKNRWGLID